MKTKAKQTGGPRSERLVHLEHEAEGIAGGAITGAVLGAIAGPAGAAAGAIVGGIAGAAAAIAVDDEAARQREHAHQLDVDIGVEEGEIGAPGLKHPPARIGAFSSGSMGAGGETAASPAEGPMQPVDE